MAYKESQLPVLQDQVFSFLNDRLRQTILRSACDNTRLNFADPLPHHLRRAKDSDDILIKEDLSREEKEACAKGIDERFKQRTGEISEQLKRLRNGLAIKRAGILLERTKELVNELRRRIEHGAETNAYEIYQDIIAGRELRKYPYHFEIEMLIVDNLNSLLKNNFRQIVRNQVEEVFAELTEKVQDALEKVREDVAYNVHIMSPFDSVIREEAASFVTRVDGVVMTLAAQLDELLVFKPKGFMGLGGNEMLNGLEHAAKMGLENLKKPGQAILSQDFAMKTQTIRDTLTMYYIPKVGEYHEQITQDIFPIVINNMQQIEKRIMEVMQSKYRPALETIIAEEVNKEFGGKRKGIEQRSRRFRELIEDIETTTQGMVSTMSSVL